MLPRLRTEPPKAPPIKIQGIKTKLIPLIEKSISWNNSGRWVEPFMGSAAVALNIAPKRALLCDTNEHLIRFYQAIQKGELNGITVKEYLQKEGKNLLVDGEKHYYYIRDRFNSEGSSFDFLFLSRACFNGMMRFNRKGGFNVPFCRKPERFRQALITKIVNQVEWAASIIDKSSWEFKVQSWQRTILEADADAKDIIYLDPPYVGRHTDYFNAFSDEEAVELANSLKASNKEFAFSNWLENKYRRNDHVFEHFSEYEWRQIKHFYHVGPSESLRNEMEEVLILTPSSAAKPINKSMASNQAPISRRPIRKFAKRNGRSADIDAFFSG